MTTELLLSLLQWLVPAGGLGAVAVWITNRTLRATRTNKEVHNAYKAMYEDVQATLLTLQNENKKLYKAVNRLERTIARASACPHWGDCPIRNELQEQPADGEPADAGRLDEPQGKNARDKPAARAGLSGKPRNKRRRAERTATAAENGTSASGSSEGNNQRE